MLPNRIYYSVMVWSGFMDTPINQASKPSGGLWEAVGKLEVIRATCF